MSGPRRLSIRLSMIVSMSMSIGPPVGAFVVLICSGHGAPDNVFASVNPMYYNELSNCHAGIYTTYTL